MDKNTDKAKHKHKEKNEQDQKDKQKNEQETKTLSVRKRDAGDLGAIGLAEFIRQLKEDH